MCYLVRRASLKKGIIFVELLGANNDHFGETPGPASGGSQQLSALLQSGDMLMVESPTYYRAYRPVLQALQEMRPEKLPFQATCSSRNHTVRFSKTSCVHFPMLSDIGASNL